ncbi:aminotransferase class I/II-fold pyridoxal phosphate-dependent enzyme [Weissella diestrammenae]|uniref:Aminotransferase n=1 Tax=Weissella diestrammenae TaxID=1162633 RepID=A0A7G9T748_9LACO|nr:aminotransferase class I/II-fold pyridoxal phosphate-dependent enzyme [Weissella diestrammenae]MCM0582477.1 aminotransferase class I/II-fold pyridoxal phosphate-dependent enzyme [Weissella diestrammenae]QNN75923.1 aminotransferase class I/II-fold pyridoxal phosphate-dependent enzyme [Weissella diestrammenae]
MIELKSGLLTRLNQAVRHANDNQILRFSREISGIEGLVRLTVGEPDFTTPEHIKNAAINSIQADDSHYGQPRGSVQFRQNVARYLSDKYQLAYTSDDVMATVGVTEAIYATLKTLLNPGDSVIIPMPTFPFYAATTEMIGGKVIPVDMSATDFKLTPALLQQTLAAHPEAKALIIATPGNPTGVVYQKQELEALASVLEQTDLIVISDEIYSEIVYTAFTSMGTVLPNQTIVFNGVSKSHAMTGYRLGVIAGPKILIDEIDKVHQLLVTTPTNAAVAAATEAFSSAGYNDSLPMRAAYLERLSVMLATFDALKLEYVEPDGAFYLWFKVPTNLPRDDNVAAKMLAEQAKVGVIPGSYFGTAGNGWLRASFATSLPQIKLAMNRLTAYLTRNKRGEA